MTDREALAASALELSVGRTKPEDPDRGVMLQVEALNCDALAVLYDRHAPRLLGLSRRILGENGEAEEVLQEVFLFAWRAASSFDASRGSVLTWLLIATRSRSLDRLRARKSTWRLATKSLEQDWPARPHDVEASVCGRQWEVNCRAALRDLPALQRRTLELAYFEGLTQQEIADRTATPVGTVKTRVRLGLMKLRDSLHMGAMAPALPQN